MFRLLVTIALAAMLSACAYNYRVGVAEDVPASELATLKASFAFDINEIDGRKFKEKFNFSAIGSNTMSFAPGRHILRFRYCDCNMNSSVYTFHDSYVVAELVAGRHYELYEIFETQFRNFREQRVVRFEVREIAGTPATDVAAGAR